MSFEKFLFYLFAAITLLAATMVVSRRNPVHSALYLVLAFFSTAGLWLLMEAEFLAITLVLVYVGAVMVLFLFVVMMLDINVEEFKPGCFIKYLPVGLLIAGVMLAEMVLLLGPQYFGLDVFKAPAPMPADYSNTEAIGQVLYTVYMYPFEIAAVILVVAIVAAIGLTMRRRKTTKYQNPTEQVSVKASDRLRVIKMPSEGAES